VSTEKPGWLFWNLQSRANKELAIVSEGFERIPFLKAYKMLRAIGIKPLKAVYWAAWGLKQYVIKSNKR
jgi:hypothetical protein